MSSDNIRPEPKLTMGTYKHYKGNLYEVMGLACHSETHEWLVIYKPLYEHPGMPNIWLRPYDMFVESVNFDNKVLPRFELVDKQQ